MLIKTKHFGEIDLHEDKIIHFEHGIFGFENHKNYTILYDTSENERPYISWLQSLEEEALALPVINPFLIKEDYNPEVEDELLGSLGVLTDENAVVLTSITVPNDIHNMTVNLKAPFVINSDLKKGCQIVAQNSDYEVKHKFYEKLQELKTAKGDL